MLKNAKDNSLEIFLRNILRENDKIINFVNNFLYFL